MVLTPYRIGTPESHMYKRAEYYPYAGIFVMNSILHSIFNRPSLAGANLQVALLLTTDSSFSSKSSNYHNIIAKVAVLFGKLKICLAAQYRNATVTDG